MTGRLKDKISSVSYKYLLAFGIFVLVLFISIILFIYIYQSNLMENREETGKSTEFLSKKIVESIDEKLTLLENYYVVSASDTDIQWIIQNDFDYSDYSKYKAVMDIMGGRKMFTDYIESYALVLYNSEKIISSKGILNLKDIVNRSDIQNIYRNGRVNGVHHFWIYSDSVQAAGASVSVDPNYRTHIDTDGLLLIVRLPFSSVNTSALGIIKINTDTLEDIVKNSLSSGQIAVIVSDKGNIIYSTDDSYNDFTLSKFKSDNISYFRVHEKGIPESMGVETKSQVTGWHFFVYSELSTGVNHSAKFMWTWLGMILIILVIAGLVTFLGYQMYTPIGNIMQKVAHDKTGEQGNEFKLIETHIESLAVDKETLEQRLESQKSKVLDMFSRRLINEGIKTDDEWNDYMDGLKIEPQKCFAVGTIVLDIRNELYTQSTIDEDSICLEIIEQMPAEIKDLLWMPAFYNNGAIVAFFGNENEDLLLKDILTFNEKLKIFSFKLCGYYVLSGISSTCHDFKHFRRAYRESIKALTKQGYEEYMNTDTDTETFEKKEDLRFYVAPKPSFRGESYSNNFENDIFLAIKEVDKVKAYHITDRFAEHLVTVTSSDIQTLYIMRYVNSIVLTALEAGLGTEELFPDSLSKVYDTLLEAIEPRTVRKKIKALFIDPVIDKLTDKMQNDSYLIMESIDRLMEKTKGNILLAECADELKVHQTYIWKILKMQKGKSFTEYAEKYKIEEAKKLLLQTNMSVQDIAAQLDYANAQNFIRFFSRVTGLTPGKFRKLY